MSEPFDPERDPARSQAELMELYHSAWGDWRAGRPYGRAVKSKLSRIAEGMELAFRGRLPATVAGAQALPPAL